MNDLSLAAALASTFAAGFSAFGVVVGRYDGDRRFTRYCYFGIAINSFLSALDAMHVIKAMHP